MTASHYDIVPCSLHRPGRHSERQMTDRHRRDICEQRLNQTLNLSHRHTHNAPCSDC